MANGASCAYRTMCPARGVGTTRRPRLRSPRWRPKQPPSSDRCLTRLEPREPRQQLLDLRALLLEQAALFLDLVQQQRVDEVVAHRLRLSVLVVDDQPRRDLGDFLGHKA